MGVETQAMQLYHHRFEVSKHGTQDGDRGSGQLADSPKTDGHIALRDYLSVCTK